VAARAAAAASNWNVDAGDAWTTPADWSAGVPNSIDSTAAFTNIITAPRTISVTSPQTVGHINFNSAISYTIDGSAAITLSSSSGGGNLAGVSLGSGSHTIAAPLVAASDPVFLVLDPDEKLTLSGGLTATGRNVITTGSGVAAFTNLRANTLTINDGTTQILPNGTPAGASRLGSVSVAFNSELDLTNNDLQITGGNTYGQIATLIFAGLHGGGVPSGQPALLSSAPQPDPAHARALGLMTGAQFGTGRTFDGFAVSAGDVLVKYTLLGDTDFDGTVNVVDLANLAGNFGRTNGAMWVQGDFNYDGSVNVADLADLAGNFGATLAGGAAAAAVPASSSAEPAAAVPTTSVPEPWGISVLSLAMCALPRRRRRRGGDSRFVA
jgi:hypothetical protein